ncbi:serine/threonine protein kinase [Acaryochloris marina]|uniref:non-specific serine/threonine protein kinase n=1 Tax=Acaryochloris marina (strain MBIC 11017) TaxID=329726 RepID=B0CG94_ACAM1|nr:serine/threonine protein kinase [Acaryochloris marina]ABW30647.1 serine/threonine protein kinase [Acaryochloris marina MBIC11017]
MLGTLLDQRYRVTAVLGAGGFGQTYIAEDTRRPGNPQCVVKHLKPASSDTQFIDVARRLFRTEAEMLEKLGRHDQIPQLLAYFEDQKEFYLVQEFIQGQPLSDEMPLGQPLPEAQVLGIVQEILNVLHFVHYHQVIHRDIKPDNLIRRRADGHLVLIDFGAVKEIRTQIAPAGQSVGYTVGIGTQGYMPGEQLSGRPRLNSDIYAVGMIGIKAMTGVEPIQLPFNEQTAEIQWRSLAPQVSPRFAEILERMVRSQFNTRYPSVADVLQDLQLLSQPIPAAIPPTEPVIHSGSIPPTAPIPNPTPTDLPATNVVSPKPVSPQPSRSSWWIAAGIVGLSGLGGAYALGLMPNFSGLNGRSSDPTVSPSASVEPSAEPSPTPSFSPPPTRNITPLPSNCKVTVNDPNPPLNIRSSPEVSPNNIVATADNGTPLSVLGSQGKWLQIQSPDGWVSKNLTRQVCPLGANRVRFAPGATEAVLTQTLNQHERQPFLLQAQAQQTMTVRLTRGSVEVQVLDPQGRVIAQADRQTPVDKTTLPTNGDYTIAVENQQPGAEQFSVDVEVVTPRPISPKDTTSRVQFAPGTTGTQLNNTIQPGQRQRYLLNAGAQQFMGVKISQGDIQLTLFSPSGQLIGQLDSQATNWQGQLPQSGDYRFEVSTNQTSPYSINIEIE